MEKREIITPQADKVVGIPKEWEHSLDKVEKTFHDAYQTQEVEKIEGLELEKTEKDLKIINFVNTSVEKQLQQYGRNIEVDTPLEKIHLLREGGTEEYTKGRFRIGAHSINYGSILVDRDESDEQFAIILFHEQMHNNCYKALQLTKGDKPKVDQYRSGISVTSRDGKMTYFEDLEEATIQLLTERFYRNEVSGSRLFGEEKRIENPSFSRAEESEKLNGLIDSLWLKNQNSFENRQEVEDILIGAQINGNLLPFARLVEKTYGKGSFRKIGEETSQIHGK